MTRANLYDDESVRDAADNILEKMVPRLKEMVLAIDRKYCENNAALVDTVAKNELVDVEQLRIDLRAIIVNELITFK
jgi:hypothetical protein